jgi:DNA-binding PadR family transcriptional regulator
MARRLNSSQQIETLVAALLQSGDTWRYGYDLSRETGLKSGTLYPILMRLEGQGWLETDWADAESPGRPRRHLYRLSAHGSAEATALLAAARQRAAPTPVLRTNEAAAQ